MMVAGAEARRTHSSTPPPSAPTRCFSRRPRRREWPWPFDPGPPDPKFEFGRWLVTPTKLGREVNGHSHRMFCSLHLAMSIYGSNHEQR